jgi:hypothetical protein
MVYPGFIFSICVIKEFGDFPNFFGQKVTKFVPRISLLLSPKFLVFPVFENVNSQFSLITNLIIFAYKEV